MPIVLLTLENLLDINEGIKKEAAKDKNIEYRGSEDYPIRKYKLKKLIEYTPYREIIDLASYYLKNIILLQAFPDANHRTALAAVEVFLNKNEIDLDYTPEEAYLFQKECYGSRLRIYGTYEEMPVSILKENDNDLFILCKEFIQNHIVQLSKFY